MTSIHGSCEKQLEPLRAVFASHFAEGWEIGASLSVVLDGQTVLDVWGGHADRSRTHSWAHDTIVNVFSVTKGVVALLLAILVDEGRLDYDAPVAQYWPEFGCAGKENIRVATLLSHQAGLCAFEEPVQAADLLAWSKMVGILERSTPIWEPGKKTGYHARTFGFLAGMLIRKITGRAVGDFLQDRLGPVVGDGFLIAVPATQQNRIADIVGPDQFWERQQLEQRDDRLRERMDHRLVSMMGLDTRSGTAPPPAPDILELMTKVFTSPFYDPELANSPSWRAAEIPSSNGHGNARSLARLYGALARGGELEGRRIISSDALAQAVKLESDRLDSVLGFPVRWGRGFTLNGGEFGPHPEAFGHRGIGGSFAYGDPRLKLGVAYTANQMIPKFGDAPGNDPRADRFVSTLYRCL